MRIIGGDLGGRRFHPPSDMPYTRPTTDVAKEGLFNVIENNRDIESLKTCDLFGGTGSITYELASRGASDLTIVEKDSAMFAYIKKTLTDLKIDGVKLVKMDVFKFIRECEETFDLIFAGPPYALTNIDDLPVLVFSKRMLKPGGWFILEHTPRNRYEHLEMFSVAKNYGTTVFSIFVNRQSESAP
jgi:16S rRNA (guanine966-N2)-methyltransferase